MQLSRRCLLALGVITVAGVPATLPAVAAEPIPVVASFSILADFVRQVGGERVDVTSLVGPDGDAHVFTPSPADASRVGSARVVFVNGLGLEGWIERLVQASGTKATVVVASAGVKPIKGEEPDRSKNDSHGHGSFDPHAWQDVANAQRYVANIRDGLIAADPPGQSLYEANAARYLAELDRLEAEVKVAIGRIPASRRRIITTHDAFGYFAAAYGMEFLAPQGVSTDTEATAKDVAKIIRQIKAQKIPAVFLENVSDPRLIGRIAKESGAKVGGRVFSDALSGPDGPAATYLDMMRNNLRAFSEALTS